MKHLMYAVAGMGGVQRPGESLSAAKARYWLASPYCLF
jgi:hypothetical protein